MSTDLTPFDFDGQAVRVVTIDGEPWFVLTDLCAVLGISDVSIVRRRLDDGACQTHPISDRLGRTQQSTIVSESGMYEVVIRSDKPDAVRFRRWITSDVLPTIRKTGGYGMPDLATLPARDVLAIAQRLVEQEERAARAEARAVKSERVVDAIEAAEGLTPTQFHKHYFSDVRATDFFEFLYRRHLLIDQRGTRGRDDKGRLKNGLQHQHPAAAGKAFFYLHGRLDRDGARRESVRVRPGRPEVELVEFLASKGLPANTNALTTTPVKEIAA